MTLSDVLQRGVRNGRIASAMALLQSRNLLSRSSVLDPAGPVVSLTTFGRRARFVHLAIESIARGDLRPSRLVLWLDEEEGLLENLPAPLTRLQKRGLEIHQSPNCGPHKKYWNHVQSLDRHERPLATADDDQMYPRRWLASLVEASAEDPGRIVAHRAHYVVVGETGIEAYRTWPSASSALVSPRNFGLGVGGVLYPPAFLDQLRQAGDAFRSVTPRADDVWLHAQALRGGWRVRVLDELPESEFLPIRGTGVKGLQETNVGHGGNDTQIASTYTDADLALLRSNTSEPV